MSSSRIPTKRHYNCIPRKDFYNEVIMRYTQTKEQKRWAQLEICEDWEEVNHSDLSRRYIYSHDDML